MSQSAERRSRHGRPPGLDVAPRRSERATHRPQPSPARPGPAQEPRSRPQHPAVCLAGPRAAAGAAGRTPPSLPKEQRTPYLHGASRTRLYRRRRPRCRGRSRRRRRGRACGSLTGRARPRGCTAPGPGSPRGEGTKHLCAGPGQGGEVCAWLPGSSFRRSASPPGSKQPQVAALPTGSGRGLARRGRRAQRVPRGDPCAAPTAAQTQHGEHRPPGLFGGERCPLSAGARLQAAGCEAAGGTGRAGSHPPASLHSSRSPPLLPWPSDRGPGASSTRRTLPHAGSG